MSDDARQTLVLLKWEAGQLPTFIPPVGSTGLYCCWPIYPSISGSECDLIGHERLMVVEGGGPDGLYAPAVMREGVVVVTEYYKALREAPPAIWARPAEQPEHLPSLTGRSL
ncbi:MAG TPA: hypothetical protein PLE19_12805 [Planctomycetota bacterium]|nr:hypothetical protein [Planctomycetota bacterium]HRR82917.1 hypothetical protein [Planctomycetota bacterium]HRT95771.1 hypothetical protein [Planctomycetota bacterium]